MSHVTKKFARSYLKDELGLPYDVDTEKVVKVWEPVAAEAIERIDAPVAVPTDASLEARVDVDVRTTADIVSGLLDFILDREWSDRVHDYADYFYSGCGECSAREDAGGHLSGCLRAAMISEARAFIEAERSAVVRASDASRPIRCWAVTPLSTACGLTNAETSLAAWGVTCPKCLEAMGTAAKKTASRPGLPIDREVGGRLVREVWVEHARSQPNPKPHHLDPWEKLDEPNREVDRLIAERVAQWALDAASEAVANDELAEIERFGGAMAGPWRAYYGEVRPVDKDADQLDPLVSCYGDNTAAYPLAEFIARARSLLPRFVAAHRAALASRPTLTEEQAYAQAVDCLEPFASDGEKEATAEEARAAADAELQKRGFVVHNTDPREEAALLRADVDVLRGAIEGLTGASGTTAEFVEALARWAREREPATTGDIDARGDVAQERWERAYAVWRAKAELQRPYRWSAVVRAIDASRPADPDPIRLTVDRMAMAALTADDATRRPFDRAFLDALGKDPDDATDEEVGQAKATALRRMSREHLGRLVREEWVTWAREQPNPKASWLAPWEELAEPDREVDRRIGERVAQAALVRQSTLVATCEWQHKPCSDCGKMTTFVGQGLYECHACSLKEARAENANLRESAEILKAQVGEERARLLHAHDAANGLYRAASSVVNGWDYENAERDLGEDAYRQMRALRAAIDPAHLEAAAHEAARRDGLDARCKALEAEIERLKGERVQATDASLEARVSPIEMVAREFDRAAFMQERGLIDHDRGDCYRDAAKRMRAVDASRPGLSKEQARAWGDEIAARVFEHARPDIALHVMYCEAIRLASRGEIPEEVRAAAKPVPPPPYTGPWPLCIDCVTEPGMPPTKMLPGLDTLCAKCDAGGYMWAPKDADELPEIQSTATDAAIGAAVAQAKNSDVAMCAACGKKPADLCLDCEDQQHKAGATWDAAGLEKVRAACADPLAGLPEEDRHRIKRAGIAARLRTYRDSGETQHDLATRNERDAIAREVAAYHARQGVPETLTREEAEALASRLSLAARGMIDLDNPRECLRSFDASFVSGPPDCYTAREIVRAYVRWLDAQGTAS